MVENSAIVRDSVTTRSRGAALRRQKTALPVELVLGILERLSLNELWTTARVSREFYSLSWRAGLFIHRNINWTTDYCYVPRLEVFKEVLEHAKQKDLRLSLSIWSFFPGEYVLRCRASIYQTIRQSADEIIPVITAALPFLVRLSIRLPDYFRPQLDAALRHPAPRLRMLELARTLYDEPSPPLPCDLFAGLAPNLRMVTCSGVALSDEPVAVFGAVTHVALSYENRFPPVPIRLQFPHVTSLHLGFLVVDDDAVPPGRFDLVGIALHSLVIQDCDGPLLLDTVQRSIDLSTIAAVHVIADTISWTESLWTNDPAMASMRICVCPDAGDDIYVMVTPEHRRWQRLYRLIVWATNEPLPIAGLPNISNRLTYLRIDAALLRAFLALALPFLALRDLHIDVWSADAADDLVLAPPDYGVYWRVQSFEPETPHNTVRIWAACPALEEITLFAFDAPIKNADSRRVAFLSRALGQLERPKTERVALALVGVQFEKPVARVLLDQTVSKICKFAFAGGGSLEDHDDGLWDHGF
ncbi:hypothetical protein AURDEDRAFT_165500 [Auricularia subglabra TFB-10046 SS5]|nr:hypothetical protein AURDEDRAFT_165500 [Auricularia subglabra TFB-10046 SS5]